MFNDDMCFYLLSVKKVSSRWLYLIFPSRVYVYFFFYSHA